MPEKKKVRKRKAKPAEPGFAVPQNEAEELRHVSVAPCSLELSRDAKGQARWSLKLYGERDEMNDVLEEVLRLDNKLRRRTQRPGLQENE